MITVLLQRLQKSNERPRWKESVVEYLKIWRLSGEALEKDENFNIAGSYAKIRTGYLPDANLERYHYVAWRRRS